MTLDEAIKYAEDMAFLSHKGSGNTECEHNHRQLAEWLRELKDYRARIPSYETGYNDAKREIALSGEYERAYERGKSDAEQTRWIPVTDRLPEEETDVLICNGNGDIELSSGSYSTEVENDFIWYTSGWRFGKVMAWMPLPQPYKAERNEEK